MRNSLRCLCALILAAVSLVAARVDAAEAPADATANDQAVAEIAYRVVIDAPSVHEALRTQPPRRHVIKDGREVARATLLRELVRPERGASE